MMKKDPKRKAKDQTKALRNTNSIESKKKAMMSKTIGKVKKMTKRMKIELDLSNIMINVIFCKNGKYKIFNLIIKIILIR